MSRVHLVFALLLASIPVACRTQHEDSGCASAADASCDACAAGLQDHDGDGVCAPACTDSSCHGHGTCADSTGAASCSCATGYTGPGCGSCAAGFQDNDHDGACAPVCETSTCNGRGTCSDTSGQPVCSCSGGYAGATCGACAAGLQDNDHDGVCTASCASTPACPGAHQACGDETGTATCACAAGHADSGSGCAWVGVIRDPSFDRTPADAWAASGGAQVLPSSTLAFFGHDAICTDLGAVTQRVTMPPASAADRLALSVTANATCNAATCPWPYPSLAVGFGGKRHYIQDLTKGNSTTRICLGEAALGGTRALELSPSTRSFCASSIVTASIDRVDVSPDPACPPLGTLVNGAFTDGDTGWTLGLTGSATGGLQTGPFDGTAAFHVHSEWTCSDGSAKTLLSIPLAEGAALRFDSQLTAGKTAFVQLDGRTVGVVQGDGTPRSTTLCLSDAVAGTVQELYVYAANAGPSCYTSSPYDFYLDNVEVVTDPACAGEKAMSDPGAEIEPSAAIIPWELSAYDVSTATFTRNPAEVHGGAQALKLSTAEFCGYASVRAPVNVPLADATGGPALKVWLNANTLTYARMSGTPMNVSLIPSTTGWEQHTICLPPERSGGLNNITLQVVASSNGGCGSPTVEMRAFLDDFEVTTDASCPTH
ncbi:hypothetical protein [Archangium sp.]|uniref:hypothetical protein n=1 Tax=Archangium sp. TaxID=1872627 RepID=UPI00389A8B79